ncbi:MAG: kelch repeat-containing protein [Terracidiphilus sp.]
MLILLACLCPSAHAQTGEWAWMGGSSNISNQCGAGDCGQPGAYGPLENFAASNSPGGRFSAATWTDKSGNLWFFGGHGIDGSDQEGYLNDLWEYSPSRGEWAWMSGSKVEPTLPNSGQAGVYGTKGVPDPSNVPGSRVYAVSWTDMNGNFWLFGGQGNSQGQGDLDYLWEFNPSTNEWVWMSGSETFNGLGVYGKLGVAAPDNQPGGREGAVSWTDNHDNLWLFGGYGLNDLWKFNIPTNEWTWMGGSQYVEAASSPGVYGTLGEPDAANVPGSRWLAASWTDASGNLWLFGGDGIDSAGTWGILNDLWKFDISTNEWTWMGGNDTVLPHTAGRPGVYGTLGVFDPANHPGSREGAASWFDTGGNVWLFGGVGADSVGNSGNLNDLWEFNPSTNQWAWMSGASTGPAPGYSSNVPGVCGTLGVPATGNVPGGRMEAVSWTDNAGNLWLFGGQGNDCANGGGNLNDLWVFQVPGNTLPVAKPVISMPTGLYSNALTVTISDGTPNSSIYYTTDGSIPTANSTLYSGAITVSSTETVQAIGVASGIPNSSVASATYTINLPLTFSLSVLPSTLTVKSGGQGTINLTVTPQNGFNSAVTFACSGLPAGGSCSFSPASVTPSGSPMTTQLTITAPTLSADLHRNSRPLLPAAVVAAALCLFGFRHRRGLHLWLLMIVIAIGLGLVSGCGGGSGGNPSTPPPPTPITSTITVTATSGSLLQSATFSLTVN